MDKPVFRPEFTADQMRELRMAMDERVLQLHHSLHHATPKHVEHGNVDAWVRTLETVEQARRILEACPAIDRD